jgi:hypothetical protein
MQARVVVLVVAVDAAFLRMLPQQKFDPNEVAATHESATVGVPAVQTAPMLVDPTRGALTAEVRVVVDKNLYSSLSKSSSLANEAAAMSERQTRILKFILNINEILNYKLGAL